MSRKILIEEMRELAKKKDGYCLASEYIDSRTDIVWMCKFGHIWSATYANVAKRKNSTWCPQCAGNVVKTIHDCIATASQRNGLCLSTKYENINSNNLQWQCESGHTWYTSYASIKRGSWCPYCAGKYNNSLEICNKFAENNGGKCISKEYVRAIDLMEWECSKGHMWKASFNMIKNGGRWCPRCRLKGKTQKLLFEIIKSLFPKFNVEYNFNKLEWLRTGIKGKQQFDIFVSEIKLAIEYDGRQHFEAISCWGGQFGLELTQNLDKIKDKKVEKHREDVRYFIRFNYKDEITKEFVKQKLVNAGVSLGELQ